MDSDEARAEALHAGIVLVAVRLVDLALAAKRRLERLHGHAVGFHGAVAAALADEIVDEDALRRIRVQAALAAPTFFGRAGLIVDQHGEAGRLPQGALHLVELVASVDRRSRGKDRGTRVFVGLVGDDHDALRALCRDLGGDLRDIEAALRRLAAGHRDGIVIEDLVGDVDARRSRRSDRQQAAVRIGAVAQVLEDVRFAGERRLPDPVRALRAHMRDGLRVALRHPGDHAVATDARHRAAALGQFRRGIVRATGAEVRKTRRLDLRRLRDPLEAFETRHTLREA